MSVHIQCPIRPEEGIKMPCSWSHSVGTETELGASVEGPRPAVLKFMGQNPLSYLQIHLITIYYSTKLVMKSQQK